MNRIQKPIYIAATKQHVGKTTVSLALTSGLKKRFGKVGFIKPVGQEHVPVQTSLSDKIIRVDKDVQLIRDHFELQHVEWEFMSPVIIPRGYTKDYIDGKIEFSSQVDLIQNAFNRISSKSDVMLCEGTGHCAVGSIVGLNNAKVAKMLNADMVLVANGGLGSAFDELELNRVLCKHHGVRVAGVILNKVIPEKWEQTKYFMSKALMDNWKMPLLGCIPDRHFLGCPALMDLEKLFKTKLVSGTQHRMKHYSVGETVLVTTNLCTFLKNLRQKPKRTLYFCHITRNDIILGFFGEYQRRMKQNEEFEAALIICGRKDKYELGEEVKSILNDVDEAPVLYVPFSTHDAIEKVHKFTPKLNIHDVHRVEAAVEHYEPHIDFEELIRRTSDNSWI